MSGAIPPPPQYAFVAPSGTAFPLWCVCVCLLTVFGAQFHHRARTSPLLAGFSPLRFFLVPQMQIGAAGAAFWGCDDN